MEYATKKPNGTAIYPILLLNPDISMGDISRIYSATNDEFKPIATPSNILPINSVLVSLNNCIIHAIIVIMSAIIILTLRPNLFAILPENIAPTAAPGAIRDDSNPMYRLFCEHFHSS